jgi:hypothetical protein
MQGAARPYLVATVSVAWTVSHILVGRYACEIVEREQGAGTVFDATPHPGLQRTLDTSGSNRN